MMRETEKAGTVLRCVEKLVREIFAARENPYT